MRKKEDISLIRTEVRNLRKRGSFGKLKEYIAHSDITVYRHCVTVAIKSLEIAYAMHLKIDRKALVRGALLHDYYLYDWHEPNHKWHGFHHSKIAADNAKRDYDITQREYDIIKTHMFPLNISKIPKSKEAWVIVLADKLVALRETMKRKRKKSDKD
jgi:uncharacterized protein